MSGTGLGQRAGRMAAHSGGGPVQRGETRAAADGWCARPILQSPESKKAWGANKKMGCSQAEVCRGLGWPKIVGGSPENWEAHGLKALGGENKSEGSPEPVGGSQRKPQAKEAPKKGESSVKAGVPENPSPGKGRRRPSGSPKSTRDQARGSRKGRGQAARMSCHRGGDLERQGLPEERDAQRAPACGRGSPERGDPSQGAESPAKGRP